MDEDYAAEQLRRDGVAGPAEAEERVLSPLGWSSQVTLLNALLEAVIRLQAAVVANYTKDHKAPHVEPLPVPKTAYERLRDQKTVDELNQLVSTVLSTA